MAWNFTGRVPGWCAERLPWARPALFEDQPERAEGAQDRCEVGEGVEVHERVIRRSQCSQKGKGEHREPVTRTELLVVGPAFIAGGGHRADRTLPESVACRAKSDPAEQLTRCETPPPLTGGVV